jgi:hypothetical protein
MWLLDSTVISPSDALRSLRSCGLHPPLSGSSEYGVHGTCIQLQLPHLHVIIYNSTLPQGVERAIYVQSR